jgi:hypothetical protein
MVEYSEEAGQVKRQDDGMQENDASINVSIDWKN